MESFFLQHNVLQDRDPDEVGGQVNSDSEASDDQEEFANQVSSVADPTGPWRQRLVNDETWGKPTRRFRGRKGRDFASVHTGPKGVINDYKAHKRYQKEERLREEEQRQAVFNRITKGAIVPFDPSTGRNAPAHFDFECDEGSDWECDNSDMEDDTFLVQYAEMRVKQMQQVARSRTVYGDLEYITPKQFVILTSNTGDHAGSSMLVHLYHPENYACGLLNTQLELLARKLVHVKFAAMMAKEADTSIEAADLPVVLIFRNHQQQEAVVDVTHRLDGEFTFDRVEAFVSEQLEL
ncbi:hypothetical protein DD238_001191 [Peronospora effusa]|uniref:Phosducin domain-containing protein n=1 Tax=Peronospora effusa TaxID=542832 RepID=A0A3M6VU43_9STRA|nr:hypothetical protein DD238_001191 [Peronospora effusa]RQM09930.1 hypothetical protein DD237_002792 [Peronospora effusa]